MVSKSIKPNTGRNKIPKWSQTTQGIIRHWLQDPQYSSRTVWKLPLSVRQLRLFGVACYRSPCIWRLLDADLRFAVEEIERCADGEGTEKSLKALHKRLCSRTESGLLESGINGGLIFLCMATRGLGDKYWDDMFTSHIVLIPLFALTPPLTREHSPSQHGRETAARVRKLHLTEMTRQGQMLAGIVGPDWHLNPEWRTDTAVQLARHIYDNREFTAMPILADALQDAGCDNEPWLARMRNSNWPWCRGCQVLDSLLQ
jgi:hypothetical protein